MIERFRYFKLENYNLLSLQLAQLISYYLSALASMSVIEYSQVNLVPPLVIHSLLFIIQCEISVVLVP
jgi:hypothetical protein